MDGAVPEPADDDPFPQRDGHIDHPYLKPGTIEARDYQTQVARDCLQKNTLVVLPTGLGKTVVAALVIAESLQRGARTVLMLAPTRPLAQQHADALKGFLRDEGLIDLFSGSVAPDQRAERWGTGRIVVATPQTIRNDLDEGRYDLGRADLVLYDEAHHAVGDYAYVPIAHHLRFQNPKARVVGLTASPGADRRRIAEVQTTLGLGHVLHRDERHADVAPYVQQTQIEWRMVDLPASIRRVQRQLDGVLQDKIETLRKLGLVKGDRSYGASKKELVRLTKALGQKLGQGQRDSKVFGGLHAAQVALQAHLALELLETQGLEPLRRHLDRLAAKKDKKRTDNAFLNDPRIVDVRTLLDKGIESSHPKMDALAAALDALFDAKPDAVAMVFAQYRDTVDTIDEELNRRGIEAERFVGQGRGGSGTGMSQQEQQDVLTRFRDRDFRVLVSTSVGEEGIDVPQVDLVVFYEAVPSEIRAIQRRGRTGRTRAGRVLVLVARGTRDEAYLKTQTSREKSMRKLVGRLK